VKNSETLEIQQLVNCSRRLDVVKLPVDVLNLDTLIASLDELRAAGGGRVCFANVHMVMEAYDDPHFREAVRSADFVVPDGMPLVWMQKLLGRGDATRVRGKSVMVEVLRRAGAKGSSVGFYGGTPKVLDAVRRRATAEFPQLSVSYAFSPPFRTVSDAEHNEIVRNITAANPDILFVGLGCPKQEIWMADHYDKLSCVMLGVGAAFDFYAGSVRESPEWLSRLGLEWLYRLAKEPRRLWRRYLSTNPRFLFLAIRQLARGTSTSR
jgi:N-acetylglucosaminyldiphosphoundecaprenol N-acetyl-beta-D-mannosaminyltransferase